MIGFAFSIVGIKNGRPTQWSHMLGVANDARQTGLGARLKLAQREHEVAVSRALGANTTAIVRSTLVEGALLGLAGGAFGTLVAVWGTRALVASEERNDPFPEVGAERLEVLAPGVGIEVRHTERACALGRESVQRR